MNEGYSRNVALDIYRIICMFCVTARHAVGYSAILTSMSIPTSTYVIAQFFNTMSCISINGFIILSAYFLGSDRDSGKKILKFETRIIFYGICGLIIGSMLFSRVSTMAVIQSVAPMLGYHWWYPVGYIILLLFAPYVNKMLDEIGQKEHFKLIVVSILVIQIYLKMDPFIGDATFIGHTSHSIVWFLELYIIAGYIRRYETKVKRWMPLVFMISLAILYMLNTAEYYNLNIPFFERVDLTSDSSILALTVTVSSFMFTLDLGKRITIQSRQIKYILNVVVSAVFGVYLLQEHSAIRVGLWKMASIDTHTGLILLGAVVVVFVILLVLSVVIDVCYKIICKVAMNKLIDRIGRYIDGIKGVV